MYLWSLRMVNICSPMIGYTIVTTYNIFYQHPSLSLQGIIIIINPGVEIRRLHSDLHAAGEHQVTCWWNLQPLLLIRKCKCGKSSHHLHFHVMFICQGAVDVLCTRWVILRLFLEIRYIWMYVCSSVQTLKSMKDIHAFFYSSATNKWRPDYR